MRRAAAGPTLPGTVNSPADSAMDTATTPRRMRLHHHPISTTSRPVMMLAAEAGLQLDWRVVDIFSGEQASPEFTALNPSQQVPVLEDGDFRLTESSAILKYLADHAGSPLYPQGVRERALVHAAMDWVNTGLMRELAYGFAYPQLMPNHRRPSAVAQATTLAWAGPRAAQLLDVMDRSMLRPGRPYICGEHCSLADLMALSVLTLGEVAGQHYGRWPQLQRWLARMKARPSYARSHDHFMTFAQQVAGPAFELL